MTEELGGAGPSMAFYDSEKHVVLIQNSSYQ